MKTVGRLSFMEQKKVICVVGTRPEAIKMAPLILALKKEPWVSCQVLATAQHREMLDQILEVFGIVPDVDFDLMRPNQGLSELTARVLSRFSALLDEEKPDVVIAEGDTTTVMTVALCCFYHRVPFGHVEAGLRTWDMDNPFPEEMNRVIAGRIAQWHFAPTLTSKQNLLKEGIPENTVHVTGNTVIDSLFSVLDEANELPVQLDSSKKLVLVTAHRRENFGEPIENICRAIKTLVDNNPEIEVLYPVHPNPNVRDKVNSVLSGHNRIKLCAPLDYLPFIAAMKAAYLILSDSGGVQEEAPAIGKPVLVLREETERPEAIKEGVVKLVGSNFERIVEHAQVLLDDDTEYKKMATGASPYGDGKAVSRIVEILRRHFDTA